MAIVQSAVANLSTDSASWATDIDSMASAIAYMKNLQVPASNSFASELDFALIMTQCCTC